MPRTEFGRKMDLAGFATLGLDSVNLSPDTCDLLADFAYRGARPTGFDQLETAFAVVVLMHETSHVLNQGVHPNATEEQTAECWAMQHIREAAVELGASSDYADTLAERYWSDVYPLQTPKYKTDRCRDSGRLDVRRGSHVWP